MLRLEGGLKQRLAQGKGRGVRILLLDSGVEGTHPDLAGRDLRAFALGEGAEGVQVREETPVDTFGHGTAVATAILREVPEASLHSLRVLGKDLRAHSERILQALQWGVAQGYPIINCSFGTPSEAWMRAYKEAVEQAYLRNAWIVAASSNVDIRMKEYPAHLVGVFAVGCGAHPGGESIFRRHGDLVEYQAHGVDLDLGWKGGGTRRCTGSSFAAPKVAALLARLREAAPELGFHEAKAILGQLLPPLTPP